MEEFGTLEKITSIKPLGEGVFGTVYAADSLKDYMSYAIKIPK